MLVQVEVQVRGGSWANLGFYLNGGKRVRLKRKGKTMGGLVWFHYFLQKHFRNWEGNIVCQIKEKIYNG